MTDLSLCTLHRQAKRCHKRDATPFGITAREDQLGALNEYCWRRD
jgi:hypothetical protein